MCRTPWSNLGSTGVGRCVICAERVGLISQHAWTVSRTGCDRRHVAVGWVLPGNFDWRAQHETPRLHSRTHRTVTDTVTDTHTHGARAEPRVSAD